MRLGTALAALASVFALSATALAQTPPSPAQSSPPNFTFPNGDTAFLDLRNWVIPTGRQFARLYPDAALQRGRNARMMLDCRITQTGHLEDCKATEIPESSNLGFEAATQALGAHFIVQTKTLDGRSTVGGRVRFPVRWNAGLANPKAPNSLRPVNSP